jgi:hypothetical protein
MLVVHVANIMVTLDANMLPNTNTVHKWFIEMIVPVMRMVGIIVRVRNRVNSSVRHRQSRHGAEVSGAHGSDKPASLGPNQADAECRDQRIAGDLDDPFGAAHGSSSGIEQPSTDADNENRDKRLHKRRGKRQSDTASRGLLIGDEIGRNHGFAVAWAGGVEDAVRK